MKHTVYLALTVLLCLLLSLIAHAVIEILYLGTAVRNDNPVVWRYYLHSQFPCALPPILFYGLPIFGIVGGFLIGRIWWRWVYVEGRQWRNRKTWKR